VKHTVFPPAEANLFTHGSHNHLTKVCASCILADRQDTEMV